MSFYFEKTPAQITLFLGISKTKSCENDFCRFFFSLGERFSLKTQSKIEFWPPFTGGQLVLG
jgi:hypothetical protein